MSPDYSTRDYLLPKGCKDLIDLINLQKGNAPVSSAPGGTDAEMSRAELERELNLTTTALPPITGEIVVSEKIQVAELAAKLGQMPFKIVADLIGLGVFANATQVLNFATAAKIARKYGYKAKMVG